MKCATGLQLRLYKSGFAPIGRVHVKLQQQRYYSNYGYKYTFYGIFFILNEFITYINIQRLLSWESLQFKL